MTTIELKKLKYIFVFSIQTCLTLTLPHIFRISVDPVYSVFMHTCSLRVQKQINVETYSINMHLTQEKLSNAVLLNSIFDA